MNENNQYHCAFCEKRFSKPSSEGCGSCELSKGCKKIKCPYCGYDNVPESEQATFWQRLLTVAGIRKGEEC